MGETEFLSKRIRQVALKRQQATEDAIALGLRSVATGTRLPFLPPGPIFGMTSPSEDSHHSDQAASPATSPSQPMADGSGESGTLFVKSETFRL